VSQNVIIIIIFIIIIAFYAPSVVLYFVLHFFFSNRIALKFKQNYDHIEKIQAASSGSHIKSPQVIQSRFKSNCNLDLPITVL